MTARADATIILWPVIPRLTPGVTLGQQRHLAAAEANIAILRVIATRRLLGPRRRLAQENPTAVCDGAGDAS